MARFVHVSRREPKSRALTDLMVSLHSTFRWLSSVLLRPPASEFRFLDRAAMGMASSRSTPQLGSKRPSSIISQASFCGKPVVSPRGIWVSRSPSQRATEPLLAAPPLPRWPAANRRGARRRRLDPSSTESLGARIAWAPRVGCCAGRR